MRFEFKSNKLNLQNLISAKSKKNINRKIIPIVLASAMLMNSAPVTAFADNRDAGIMNKDRGKYTYSSDKYNGVSYDDRPGTLLQHVYKVV